VLIDIDALPLEVRDWKINGEHPHSDEHKHGRKFHPLSHGTDDQSRCDDGEHQRCVAQAMVNLKAAVFAREMKKPTQ
jgi:hypothetical protein